MKNAVKTRWIALALLLPPILIVAPGGRARGADAGLGDNAALTYLRAFLDMPQGDDEIIDFPEATDDATVTRIRARLDRHQSFLGLFRRAALTERIAWGVEADFTALLPHLAKMRQTARLLRQRAHLRDRDGHLDAALEDIDTILRAGRHLLEPSDGRMPIVEGLVGIALIRIGHNTLGEFATTPERTARVEAFLAERPPFPPRLMLANSLAYERETTLNFFSDILEADAEFGLPALFEALGIDENRPPPEEFDLKRFAELATTRYVRYMDELVALMDLPLAEAVSGLEDWDKTMEQRRREAEARDDVDAEARFAEVVVDALPTLALASKVEADMRASRVMVQAGAARLRGATPDELARFVDPVHGQPFRYLDDDDSLYIVCPSLFAPQRRYPSVRLGPVLPALRVKRFTEDAPDGQLQQPPNPPPPAAPMPLPGNLPAPGPAPVLDEEVF